MQEHPFAVDGEKLHGEYHPAQGTARGAVLLVHGFNSCLQEFGAAPQWLAEAGFHVFGYDQRGFGDSEGEEGLTSVERFNADLDAATGQLQGLAPNVPLAVVAHSLGAALLLQRLNHAHPFDAACIAHPVMSLYAPVPVWKRPVMRGVGLWSRVRRKRGGDNVFIGRESDYSRLFVDDDLAEQCYAEARYISSRVNAGVYELVRTMDPVAWAAGVDVATLAVLGPNDALIPYRDSLAVTRALGQPAGVIEHRGGHSCFRDLDAKYVTDAVGSWLTQQLVTA